MLLLVLDLGDIAPATAPEDSQGAFGVVNAGVGLNDGGRPSRQK
jgi:hypothetical protein